VICVYQTASLIEPMRQLMAFWDEMFGKALNQDNVIGFKRDWTVQQLDEARV